MKQFYLIITAWLVTGFCYGQGFNTRLVANVNDYAEEEYNDIWGFVDKNGIEYAVIGTRRATLVYSLENPSDPQEIIRIPGASSVWRDFKAFGDFIYVVADQGSDGILIIDMSDAPSNVTFRFHNPEVNVRGLSDTIRRCHNLYIDEQGLCYLSGCRLNSGGPIIFDVASDPGNPIFLGASEARYSHDNFARGDTIWSADILSGFFSVIDASDPSQPTTLATQQTSSSFTHNTWLSDDGDFLFTTDERANASVDAYDVSDLDNIQLVDRFKPVATEGSGVIPHNTHYYNGFLVTSWYTDGLVVVDANRPQNMIEVASYDTWPGADGGFNGCWGAYPFLPSGLVLAADIATGLYVFEVDYRRACYLEGQVTDAGTGANLQDVRISIENQPLGNVRSNSFGQYQTGIVEAGQYQVTYEKSGYFPKTIMASLDNGVVTILNVTLDKLPIYTYQGQVVDASDGTPIMDAEVLIQGPEIAFTERTDQNGSFEIRNVFQGQYTIYVGAWGYQQQVSNSVLINGNGNSAFELTFGYEDDFVLDQGWESSNSESATTGFWVREAPIGTFINTTTLSNPDEDLPDDLGSQCYITGNGGGVPGNDDVDDGIVTLLSPSMDLTNYMEPVLSYQLWFVNAGGSATPNDTLTVSLVTPTEEILLEAITTSDSEWRPVSSFPLNQLLDLASATDVRLKVETADQEDTGHLVEAGFDGFLIEETAVINDLDALEALGLSVQTFPNPFSNNFSLTYNQTNTNADLLLSVFNQLGQRVATTRLREQNGTLHLGESWPSGNYFLVISNGGNEQYTTKLIKVN